MSSNYAKLRDLLSCEDYPHRYIHKFIGKKTSVFRTAVAEMEKQFPNAKLVSERESAGQSAQAYLAFTFELLAESPDEIIDLLEATSKLADLKVIL